MATVSELTSKNIASAQANVQTWGDILLNVKVYGAKGDGVTDDTIAIQAALDDAGVAGGGYVFLPIGNYIVTSTLTFPDPCPVTMLGSGNYETTKGTRLSWKGGNDDSFLYLGTYNGVRDVFLYNGNASTGVTAVDAWGTVTPVRAPAQLNLINVHTKGFAVGFALGYTWYNYLEQVRVSYCTIGFKTGLEFNNTAFHACHTNSCDYGLQAVAGGRSNHFSACSFERSNVVGVDLTGGKTGGHATGWVFDATYFEYNAQTMIIGGFSVRVTSPFIDHDWVDTMTAAACFEFYSLAGDTRVEGATFSQDIPVERGFAFTDALDNLTYYQRGCLTLGRTYPAKYVARAITDNPKLITAGRLNLSTSAVTMLSTDQFDASAAQAHYFIPRLAEYAVSQNYLAMVLLVVDVAVVGNLTIRMGYSGPDYDQLVSQTISAPAAGVLALTVLETNPGMAPSTYHYRTNNIAATSGKYRLVTVLAG